MLALVRIFNAFRDESGSPNPAFSVRAGEVAALEHVLRAGQDMGRLGSFDPHVVASVTKAAVDDLLAQFVRNPELDLEAHAAELVTLFDRATRPDPADRQPADQPPGLRADEPAPAVRRQPDDGGSHAKDS